MPILQTHVEELQVKSRETKKTLFIFEGKQTTLKDRLDTLEESQGKQKTALGDLQQSVQANAYSLTDLIEQLSRPLESDL